MNEHRKRLEYHYSRHLLIKFEFSSLATLKTPVTYLDDYFIHYIVQNDLDNNLTSAIIKV